MSASVEKLKAARELLARPGGWTQHRPARRADGRTVDFGSSDAVCFCSYGALWAVGVDTVKTTSEELFLEEAIGGVSIAHWNDADERTQAEVVQAFTKAIALAEAEASS